MGGHVRRREDTERTRIAVRLHDDVLQELVAVLLLLENGKPDLAATRLRDTVDTLRELVFQLRSQSVIHSYDSSDKVGG